MPTPGRHSEYPPRAHASDAERLLSRLDSIQSVVDSAGTQLDRMGRLAMLGELAGFLAHEFNNILTPLLANAQVALRQPRDPERMALALERVVAGIRRATEVSESVLGLARADESVPRGTRQESVADVAQCVAEAAALVREDLAAVGAELRVEIEPDLIAAMPSVDLGEVVLNLLLNAKRAVAGCSGTRSVVVRGASRSVPRGTRKSSYIDRYLPEVLRGGDPEPRAAAKESDNSLCVVEVSDSGGGVSGAVLEGWAKRGVNVVAEGGVRTGARGEGGTGLGLEVCLRMVERAGGRIEVESRGGEGTTVRVVVEGVMSVRKAA